ncbi:unnamed protein product [Fraxinus pennsylvanica]|uniref:F-box domain-containing protein n=1 Tax=Fraxinus pennsylvanica TaxID=56036 RepID=A0AAD1ZW95_9LAMI|nr:unnamed protein product [Fraxinus pennsylvanica]
MWEENLLSQLRSRYAPRRRRRQDSGTSKASKRARKIPVPADEYADPDRISSLPDNVLRRILSFLDTKYAVATSVLSTRWKDLCISLPNIVLDDSLTFKKRKKNFEKAFEKFACKQIVLRNVPNINQFRLKCNFIEDSTIGDIVCAAICCKVKEVDLWMGDSTTVGILPLELFVCHSLVVLKLRAAVELFVWEYVSLPNLKVLHLVDFMLDGDRSMNRLFQGCKFLEELFLSRCSFGNNRVLNLSFPLLRKLSIDYGDGHFMDFLGDGNAKCKLVIDTPNLEFFEYHCHENEFHLVNNLDSLVRAKISFISKLKKWENVSELFNKMHGVKSLYLSESALEVMYSNCSSLSVFETLTFLELSAFDLRILPNILERAPQLEELVIHKHGFDDEAVLYTLPETLPVCLLEHIRNIEFKKFIGSEHDFELVKYLLQNGKVLKRMKIAGLGQPTSDLSTSTSKKISMFPRCSETIEIIFEYDDQNLEFSP